MTQPIDFSQPQRVPLIPALDSRSYDMMKDALLINCIAERQQDTPGYKIRKRFGTGVPTYNFNFNQGGYGMFFSPSGISFFNVVYTGAVFNIYNNGVLSFTNSPLIGPYPWDFEETVNYTVLGARLNSAYVSAHAGGAITQITDGDFPVSGRVSGFVHLNGRLYVMDTLGKIYGSDIDNALSWNALNLIQARSNSDLGVALVKHMSYVVAFKERTIEFFYDAGNAVGSSLSLVPGLQKPFGTLSPDSIRELDGDLYWIAINKNRSPQVAVMTNAQVKVISTPSVERVLGILSSSGFGNISRVTAVTFKSAGHSFYMINLPVITGLRQGSLVYDISEDLWYLWTKEDSSNPGTQIAMGYSFSAATVNAQYMQDVVTGARVPYGSDDIYTSDNDPRFTGLFAIRSEIITPNFELGTKRWKVLSRLSFGIDEQVESQLRVRYNDHDYMPDKWSAFRSVNLAQPEPFLKNEGRFRRRAYNFVHDQNTKMRIAYVDMQLSLGTN